METLICPEKGCGKKFTRRFNLNRHYQNLHLQNELVEKCVMCGQLFESCEDLQKHYKRFHKGSKHFVLKESAFKRSFITYRYNFTSSDINFASAQLSIKQKIEERLFLEAAEKKVCKASLIFIAQMSMNDHAGKVITQASIPFRSSSFLVTTSSRKSIRKNIVKSFNFQANALEDFIRSGSNWEFNRGLCFDIEIAKVRPITGGSDKDSKLNIKSFRQKKFLYNPCNKDEKCFLYCIANFLYEDKLSEIEKKKKDEKKYKKFIKSFDIQNISFPISVSGIKKFLNKNKNLDLKINILQRDLNDTIYPMEYGLGSGKKVVNLLMVGKSNSNHFLLIKNPNKYLRTVYKTERGLSYKKDFFCLHCLNSFSSQTILEKHEMLCSLNNPKLEKVPEKGSKHEKIVFKNYEKKHKLEYTGYLDFECVLPNCESICHVCERVKCNCDASFTDVISKQIPIAYSLLILGPEKEIIHEHSYIGKDAHIKLVEHLLDQEDLWIANLLSVRHPMIMTKKDKANFKKEKKCYLCLENFSETVVKVRDHSHYNSKYLGAACQQCNLRRRKPKKIPIFMHNGSKFDLHFIVKALGEFGDDIEYLSVLPYNGENFRTLSFNCFEFVDSLAFLQASLYQIASDLNSSKTHDYKILKQTCLVKTNKQFDSEKFEMILGKSFFPYEYCKSLNIMTSMTKLPKRKHFYSQLSEKSISKKDYKFAKKVWKKFNCKNLSDYTQIYCKIDVLILSEIFESFRDDMMKFSGLDPAHYISLPAYTFDSMLKITDAVIELPTDINMVHFLENGKRGGMSIIGTRQLSAPSSTKPSSGAQSQKFPEEDSEIVYIDANVISHFVFLMLIFINLKLYPKWGLNPRHMTYKTTALPTELLEFIKLFFIFSEFIWLRTSSTSSNWSI